MINEQTRTLEAQYADAIRLEKEALHALQAYQPGTEANAHAWQAWSEAITRTNQVWRQLSNCHALTRTARGVNPRGAAPGAGAPSQ